ncbi:NAD(+) diphosphatase [Puerhibacterium sp. TATVAM-FAB25]|uniref:NAD(+) diphosphatase n=1 Tax=Puerhibacterium sp. TATVAM-FAB25 TaxID=3093699 RepID=UPI0039799336
MSIPLDPVPALDLPLARALHDRAADHRTEADLLDRLLADPGARALVLLGDRVAATPDGADLALVAPAALRAAAEAAAPSGAGAAEGAAPLGAPLWTYLGEHAGTSYLALVLPAADRGPGSGAEPAPEALGLPAPSAWLGLRRLEALDALEQGLATEAVALANWHAVHAFCPRCGAATEPALTGWVRRCPVEDRELYPRTDPAVIMAVVDDADRILLGHAAHWPEGRFSTLAGFVEPGESLEQAVRREVAEEARLVVADGPGDVVYRGSQSWPFPASLMLGFHARVAGTGLPPRVDEVELTDARWFTRDDLLGAVEAGEVLLPGRLSIARALIEEWYRGRLPD